MPIVVYAGLPGQGKTLKLADVAVARLARNMRRHKKGLKKRMLAINIKFAVVVEAKYEGYIVYWRDMPDLVKLRDCDIFIDEISTYFDRTSWDSLPIEVRGFFRLHRHYHIKIWGTTQSFGDVIVDFRRLVDELYLVRKLVGSRDKEYGEDRVKVIWGVVFLRAVDKASFTGTENVDMKTVGFPSFFFITKALTSVYDTSAELPLPAHAPFSHVEVSCIDPNCSYKKTLHR